LDDPTIKTAVMNTFELMLYIIVFEVGIGVLLAVMVDSITRGQKFFQTVYFFPIVISATAIGMMFRLFYTYDGGLLNAILSAFGQEPKVWITVDNALRMVAIPTIWQYIGFYFVIILAAIKQIPRELYESAYLDGINGWTKTRYITIPLVRNVILTCLILAVTGTLKVFDMVMVITEGGPLNGSQLLGLYMYQKAFTDEVFGYGATIAVVIVILGLSMSLVINKLFKKEDITY
jgi:raffinose/stachyose/melibiose transport system permease protein